VSWNPEILSPLGATADIDPLDIRRELRYTANAPTDETTEYVMESSVAGTTARVFGGATVKK